MSYQQQILEYAKGQGWGSVMDELSPTQYRNAAMAVRPAREKITDGTTAVISRGLTSVGLRVVPRHIAGQNEAICENCPDGFFALLRGGQPACTQCNCSDKWLRAKWKDRRAHCPKGHWDNRQVEVSDGA